MRPHLAAVFAALLLAACQSAPNAELQRLAEEPLQSAPWSFSDRPGALIRTDHYAIYTTISDNLYRHLLVRVLESTHDRMAALVPGFRERQPLICYVFDSRWEWESHTRARAGSNAPIYLQIASGGYSQEGVFVGYDIGQDRTLSVVAHEAWHQYSWFAFKDRLPAWLEEGMATQNESFEWQGTDLVFHPENNTRRAAALRQAVRTGTLWPLPSLLSTHAGQVIRQPQSRIDAYYAQLWSLVQFLQQSPRYAPRLRALLADAGTGRLAASLNGTTVTQAEIDQFTEHWNAVAGPIYLQKYIEPDLEKLEEEYMVWVKQYLQSK